jgi:hypothetical protein
MVDMQYSVCFPGMAFDAAETIAGERIVADGLPMPAGAGCRTSVDEMRVHNIKLECGTLMIP